MSKVKSQTFQIDWRKMDESVRMSFLLFGLSDLPDISPSWMYFWFPFPSIHLPFYKYFQFMVIFDMKLVSSDTTRGSRSRWLRIMMIGSIYEGFFYWNCDFSWFSIVWFLFIYQKYAMKSNNNNQIELNCVSGHFCHNHPSQYITLKNEIVYPPPYSFNIWHYWLIFVVGGDDIEIDNIVWMKCCRCWVDG